MKPDGLLSAGQVIRYAGSLWRVDYVNECRARIVPLAKRHVTMADGREFDAERTGTSIGPTSFVEVIEDIEQERTRLEIQAAEAELASLRREAARTAELTVKATPPPSLKTPPRGASWHTGGATPMGLVPGSVKALVFAYVATHLGATTKEVAGAIPSATAGAVAACLDRFEKSGVLVRK